MRKGNLKIRSESQLLKAENNSNRTKYIKAKMEKTQKYRKYRRCGYRAERINHLISQCVSQDRKSYKKSCLGGKCNSRGTKINSPLDFLQIIDRALGMFQYGITKITELLFLGRIWIIHATIMNQKITENCSGVIKKLVVTLSAVSSVSTGVNIQNKY